MLANQITEMHDAMKLTVIFTSSNLTARSTSNCYRKFVRLNIQRFSRVVMEKFWTFNIDRVVNFDPVTVAMVAAPYGAIRQNVEDRHSCLSMCRLKINGYYTEKGTFSPLHAFYV